MDKLKTIERSIRRLEAMYDCNHEVMDADDIDELLTTIDDLKRMRLEYNREKYVEQLWQFKEYIDNSAASDNEREFQAWTEKPFIITHDGHTVTIENGAEVYNYLTDMLQNEIEDFT